MTDATIVFEAHLAELCALFAICYWVLLGLKHVPQIEDNILLLKRHDILPKPIIIDLINLWNSDFVFPVPVLIRSFADEVFDRENIQELIRPLLD